MGYHKELEIIQHTKMNSLELFLVEIISRNPHGHDDLELGLVLEGNVKLFTGQKSYLLQPGDVYVINRHQIHSLFAESGHNKILSCQIRTDFYRQVDYSLGHLWFEDTVLHDHPVLDDLRPLFLQCADFYFRSVPFASFKCSGLVLDILYQLSSHLGCHISSEKESASAYHNTMRLMRIMDYVNTHYTEQITLKDLAQMEHVSDYYISHFIRKMLGISFQEYLNGLRFRHALTLMDKTDLKILDVCMESGFSSSRYLNQMFEKHFRCTAKEYRNKKDRTPVSVLPLFADTAVQKKYDDQQAVHYIELYQNTRL